MPTKKIKLSFFLIITIFLTLGLSISFQSLLAAWSGPGAAAPGANKPAPIWGNSTVDQSITGGGGLSINSGDFSALNATITGNLGVGGNPGSEKLEINNVPGTARLRITDTDVNQNAELQLQYGSGENHWAIFNEQNGDSFNIWSYNNNTNPDNRVTILQDGNVGIGDTSPNSLLDIMLPNTINASTQLTIANINVGDYDSQIGFQLNEAANAFTIGVDDSDADKFKISSGNTLGANDRFVIDVNGNVGIGNNNPDTFLDISGALKLRGLAAAPTNPSVDNGKIYYDSATDRFKAYETAVGGWVDLISSLPTGNSGDTLRRNNTNDWVANNVIYNNGTNVGIGDQSLVEKLEINSGAPTRAKITDNNSQTSENPELQLEYWTGANDHWSLLAYKNASLENSFRIWGGGSEKLAILQNGNVGIGNTNPQAKLDVTGGIRVGSDSSTCLAGEAGTIRYNSGALELCSGSAWSAIGGSSQTPWTSAINADGFTLNGNDSASGNLTLDSTSNATKGNVLINPSGGNVGIGMTPAAANKLDVSGKIQATGDVCTDSGGGKCLSTVAASSGRYCTPQITSGTAFTGWIGSISLINPSTLLNICEDSTGCMLYVYSTTATYLGHHDLAGNMPVNFIQAPTTHAWFSPLNGKNYGTNGTVTADYILRWDVNGDLAYDFYLWDDNSSAGETNPDMVIAEDNRPAYGFKVIICDY